MMAMPYNTTSHLVQHVLGCTGVNDLAYSEGNDIVRSVSSDVYHRYNQDTDKTMYHVLRSSSRPGNAVRDLGFGLKVRDLFGS